jgi:hypothetical protein
MHNHHNRTLKISKADLIKKIKENKETHIKEYDEAVIAYGVEARKQLEKISKELDSGSLKIKLNLITPVNRSDEYDKVIEMFDWEVDEVIELTQREFNEYVYDDNDSAKTTKMLNSTYSNQ